MHAFASRTLSSRITLAIAFLAALAVVMFAAFTWFAALKADQEALRREKRLVQNGLAALAAAVPREQENFSVWDEAVIRTAAGDEEWIADNFGGWMNRFFGHDRTYVLDEHDNLIFAARDGQVIKPAAYGMDRMAAEEIVLKLRRRLAGRFYPGGEAEQIPRLGIFVTYVLEIDGRPAVLSARPILPHTNRIKLANGGEHIFLAVKFLDGRNLELLARRSLIADLAYEPARSFVPTPASIRIAAYDGGTVGYLTWTPERPGLHMIEQIAPWAALALVIAAAVGFYQARSLRRASIELHASEGRALHLAYHDVLTGLPNRALFEDRLDTKLREVREGRSQAAVLFLDLDRFKTVNDTLGHRAGDKLVRQAAARLEKAVGEGGTVARIGGDEFAVVIADRNASEAARQLSKRLLSSFTEPFVLDEEVAHIGISIGVATAPAAGSRREELLRKADIALYEAKKRGRGRYQFFSETMDDIVQQRQVVEAHLRKALMKGDELELVYQPLHSIEGKLTGAEALLRWNHPVHRSISPMFIVTIAEESGLIMQLGDWVLHEACRMAKRVPLPWIAVNVSPVQLRDVNFARRCLDIIASHNIAPHRIQVEITEAVVIEEPEVASATLRTLRAAGLRIALDDFGTGYSSMSYLRNYPLDRLKIDRFFVRALGEGEEGRAIVAAMIAMARALGLDVTAEGVETPEQLEILQGMGCLEMQGFLFSRPVSAAALVESFQAGSAVVRA